MPLSDPVPRKHLHLRNVQCHGYPDFANSARILSIFIFLRDPSR